MEAFAEHDFRIRGLSEIVNEMEMKTIIVGIHSILNVQIVYKIRTIIQFNNCLST